MRWGRPFKIEGAVVGSPKRRGNAGERASVGDEDGAVLVSDQE